MKRKRVQKGVSHGQIRGGNDVRTNITALIKK
jgi:hypothetical protein